MHFRSWAGAVAPGVAVLTGVAAPARSMRTVQDGRPVPVDHGGPMRVHATDMR